MGGTVARDRQDPPRIHVGPHSLPELEKAVLDGGGQLVPLQDAEGLVYYGTDDPRELASMLHPGLRWVQLPHAGVEPWTDAGLVTDDRVWTCASGAYGPAVAEHALALMLAAARHLHEYARATTWDGTKHTRVFAGSRVAVVGTGGIGRALIDLLAPFGCTVLAVSDRGPVAGATQTLPRAAYRDLLPESDYVVLAAPSTARTRGMVSAPELHRMRRDAWLVNVARGDLVDTDALVDALREGRIGGAALDVTAPEPLPTEHPLWHLPNVILTPHCANPTSAYWQGLVDRVADNVRKLADRSPLDGVVRTTSGY